MTRSKHVMLPAVVAGALGLGAGTVAAAEPTTEQLMKQIEQLQSKVQQLEAKQNEALSAKDVDATVDRVLQDAEKRSKMLQMEGFTAGYTKGRFTIQDAAGNWVLRPSLLMQFRSVSNYRADGKNGDTDDTESGYEVANMKFGFDGNAYSPKLSYFFLWNTETDGGNVFLEQAWVLHQTFDDWGFRVGQFANPVFHEQTTAAEYQLAADRSMINFLISGANQAFSQGATIVYNSKESPIWAEFGIEDGFDTGNTDFVDPNEGGPTNHGFFGRVNYFVQGPRSEYNDFTAKGNKEDLFVVGGGLDITSDGDTDFYRYTVDAQWENTTGLSLYGAFLGNYITEGSTDDEFCNWGVLAQAGYMINENWEGFGRVGYMQFDEGIFATPADDTYCEFTFGVNWYLPGHNAKFTFDLTILPNGSPTDIPALDILANGNTEIIYRGQFQLLL